MRQIKKALIIIALIISGCSDSDGRSCRSDTCVSLTDSGYAGSGGTGVAGSGGTSGTGGSGGSGGTGGSGGMGGSGGTDGGSAGDSGANDSGSTPDEYTIKPCSSNESIDFSSFRNAIYDENTSTCSICRNGCRFMTKQCASPVGGDGRCLPECFVEATYRTMVYSSECGSAEVCAPCINPLTNTNTGWCDNLC